MIRDHQSIANFFPKAGEMRQFFDQQFANPYEAHEGRFVWDLWHIENQYSLQRTPAYHYFPEGLYQEWEDQLIAWGQKNLGCSQISPPWLSYYVDGCFQNLHSDSPHGPWAFVFSLTNWEGRNFSGGETQLLRPEILDYWNHFEPTESVEHKQILTEIPSHMNQLTIFDPRIPHGVKPVHGSRDPRQGRLVIHGWFIDPAPQVNGPLAGDQESSKTIDAGVAQLIDSWNSRQMLHGAGNIVLRFEVGIDGGAQQPTIITDSLRPEVTELRQELLQASRKWKFPAKAQPSTITLPLIFA